MYSPTIGRFISQDTLSLDPDNPDTWNLFKYGNANPTRFIDPTGHAAEEGQAIAGQALTSAVREGRRISCDNYGCYAGPKPEVKPSRPAAEVPDDEGVRQRGDRIIAEESARAREDKAWRDRHAAVVTEDKGEGLVDKASRWRREAPLWAGDQAESIAKRGLAPSAERVQLTEEQRAAFADLDPSLTGAAERQLSRGERGQETGGDLARAGAEGGTELAIQAAETELGFKAVQLGGGAVMGGLRQVRMGEAGEVAVAREIRVSRNVGPGRVTVRGTGRGGFRIPDFPPEITLRVRGSVVEVKNVKNLSITPQLRDLAAEARRHGATLEIFTNAPAPMRGELRDLIAAKVVRIVPLP